MAEKPETQLVTRRQFLGTATAAVGIGLVGLRPAERTLSAAESSAESFSFGLVTDVHYADVARAGSRCYRDSQEKLRSAVETFNRQELSLVAELGDLVDAGPDKALDLKYLHAIREVFEELQCPRHYVLGNHCVARLTKAEFLANCGAAVQKSYYSFDSGRYHFVVLDANFKKDGSPYAAGNFSWTDTWIHEPQQRWLAQDLQKARGRKTIVLVHQNLDKQEDPHGVKNAPELRGILEHSGNVLAVFQGHLHAGGYTRLAGIPYCTLRAMVEGPGAENNAYAVVTLDKQDRITLRPFGRQQSVAFG
jgi:predicted phosphodiesterase